MATNIRLVDYGLGALWAAASLAAAAGGVLLTLPTPHPMAAQIAFLLSAICFGATGVIWGVAAAEYSPVARVTAGALAPGMALVGFVYVSSLIWAKSVLTTNSLPGFSSTMALQIRDAAVLRHQYLFEYKTPEGTKISLSLAAKGDRFIFAATDVGGDTDSLDVPVGNDGIPINKTIFLTCEVGLAQNTTFFRVLINGEEVGNRTLPFRLDLGSRNWAQGSIGADASGQNNSAFSIAMASRSHITLTDKQINSIVSRIRKYLQDVGSPLVNQL